MSSIKEEDYSASLHTVHAADCSKDYDLLMKKLEKGQQKSDSFQEVNPE